MMCLQLNLQQVTKSPITLHNDNDESSKAEEQTTLLFFQSPLTGLETMKTFFLYNELQKDSLEKLLQWKMGCL